MSSSSPPPPSSSSRIPSKRKAASWEVDDHHLDSASKKHHKDPLVEEESSWIQQQHHEKPSSLSSAAYNTPKSGDHHGEGEGISLLMAAATAATDDANISTFKQQEEEKEEDERKPPPVSMMMTTKTTTNESKTGKQQQQQKKENSNNNNKNIETLKRKIRGVSLFQQVLQEKVIEEEKQNTTSIFKRIDNLFIKTKTIMSMLLQNLPLLLGIIYFVLSNLPDDHHLDQDPPLIVAICLTWYLLIKIWSLLKTQIWFRRILDPVVWFLLTSSLWIVQNITLIAIMILVVFSFMPDDHHLELDPPMMIAIIGTWYIVKSFWSSIPTWLRKQIDGNDEVDGDGEDDTNMKARDLYSSSSSSAPPEDEDLTSPNTIWKKLSEMFDLTYQHTDDIQLPRYKIYICFFSLMHLLTELYLAEPTWHDDYMKSEGQVVALSELQTLQVYLEFADLAYEESCVELMSKLRDIGYLVVRHDVATEPGRVGHFIAVSHHKKEVVIAIKGTSSLSDVLTDLVGKAKIVVLDNGVTIRCHEGMYNASKSMLDDTKHLIVNFFLSSEYKIVICGHSLGAGVSSLLGVMLNAMDIPVQVYAYATPACLNYNASVSCQTYITSIINNDDCVPRVSLMTIRNLLKVFTKIDERLESEGRSPNCWTTTKAYMNDISKFDKDTLMTSTELIETEREAREDDQQEHALFVPGRVISIWECDTTITKTTTDDTDTDTDTTTADDDDTKMPLQVAAPPPPDHQVTTAAVDSRQLHGGLSTLRHIEVSTTMISDHGTANYKRNLKSLIETTTRK